MENSNGYIYEFGAFRLDLVKRELRREGETVALTPKVFDTLRVLVQNQGKIVTKDALMEEIWADSFVEESGLMRNISVLRKALGDNSATVPFIITVPGKGYRFLAETLQINESETPEKVNEIEETQTPSALQSLAILPFKTLGSADDNRYLALGMADALVTKLSNLEKLQIRPTSAVIKYGETDQNPFEIGRELAVESVIEGSIWQLSERLRITVQLVNIKSQTTVWADKFDENFTDIFAIQDSISEKVAAALQFQLNDGERKQLTKRETENLTAYQLYLQGFYHLNNMSAESTMQAMAYFEKSIEADPNYALPYTSLVGGLILVGLFGVMPATAFAPKARMLAARALELDQTLPAAHYTAGFSAMLFDWDFPSSEKSLLRAIKLNSKDPQTFRYYSLFLVLTGRGEESVVAAKKAVELDPVTPILILQLANCFYFSRRYDEAVAAYHKFLEIQPKFLFALKGLARCYTEKGMLEEARIIIESIEPNAQDYPHLISAKAFIYGQIGDSETAFKMIEELLEIAKMRYISPYEIALVYAGLNDLENAFAWLEKAFEERSTLLVFLKADPYFDNLRKDSRFDDLLRRVGF